MPTVLRIGPYRFHFYSDEKNEPAHIHVRSAGCECKFWLEPEVKLSRNAGFHAHELRSIETLVFDNYDLSKEVL